MQLYICTVYIYIYTPLLHGKISCFQTTVAQIDSFPKINKNGSFSDSLQGKKQKNIDPRHSMYGIFTYIYPQNYLNVWYIYLGTNVSLHFEKIFPSFPGSPNKTSFFLMSTSTISTESPGAAKGT